MPELPAVPGIGGLAAAVRRAFADGGRLARALPEFEPRSGQRQMAGAVADALAEGGVLLVEAGTGTGKTLAYLVPAILSRLRVLISTGTKNLQEQIFFKDLPLLREALGVPFTATYMKGRGNYLCLHRFEAVEDARSVRSPDEESQIAQLRAWVATTETGDRAELDDLPEDLPLWSEVAAASETCLGAGCPRHEECFITRMRQRAAASDLVIINHHLLCADAAVRQSAYGEVIPEAHYAVIDEAHQLEDVATQYFGIAVSSYRLVELVRDGERMAGGAPLPESDGAAELKDALARVHDHARRFFSLLVTSQPGRIRWAEERVRVDARGLQSAAEEGIALADALRALEGFVALLKEPHEDLLALGRRASDIREQLSFLLRADDPDYVYYLETRGRGVFLRASPIDVSAIIRDLLLERMRTTILTSATLAGEGGFEYIRQRLGIARAHELCLPSEFDYAQQAILYLPRAMPHPRAERFAAAAGEQVVEILRRTRGRAFVLFTSYANLREVRAVVERRLDYPLFVQGTAPRSALLRDFRTTPHAVLLATASFWQGVDVPGEALSCVIIDKLPFASPADPITAARVEMIAARGGSPFDDYQVPLAALVLRQGLGRLIRHRKDRGVLAILDPRLRTMGYGHRFLAALPPAPITSELDAIERFLAEPRARAQAEPA